MQTYGNTYKGYATFSLPQALDVLTKGRFIPNLFPGSLFLHFFILNFAETYFVSFCKCNKWVGKGEN